MNTKWKEKNFLSDNKFLIYLNVQHAQTDAVVACCFSK